MVALRSKNPRAYTEFDAGKFVVHKTERKFLGIGTDQAHEQNNLIVKSDGGDIGLTENPAALHRWMVAGPEITRLLTEFEKNEIDTRSALELRHAQTEGAQKKFIGEVKKLTGIICSYGNPFLEESKELLVLDSRNIVDSETARLVSEIEKIGQKQYDDFVDKQVMNGGEAVFSPIRKNKFVLFGSSTEREGKNAKVEKRFLKNDVSLFSQLYITSQVRESDLYIFFQHENQPFPPSISNNGDLKMGMKSTLIECLEEKVIDYQHPARLEVDAHVIDGAAEINMLKPLNTGTFEEYGRSVIIPYIENQLRSTHRLDIVFNRYFSRSLKNSTRKKRGVGI